MKLFVLKRLLLHSFGIIYRNIRYKTVYFFDTNFFLPKNKLPKLFFTFNRNYLITESTRKEIIDKIGKNDFQEKIENKYKTIYFDDIWNVNQTICPAYYHYISCMFNPANIGSDDFYVHWRNSRKIKKLELSTEEEKTYQWMRKKDIRGTSLDPLGNPRTGLLKFLDKLHSQTSKKISKSLKDNHPSYMQDIKSLSLILIYVLINKRNVDYYTTDGDIIILFLRWIDSLTMSFALNVSILSKLTEKEKQELFKGKTVKHFIDYNDFVKKRIRLFEDFCCDWWKEEGFRIRIKYWDQKNKQFNSILSITVNQEMCDYMSNVHGNLECNFVKNDTFGNWLSYRYYWPPKNPEERKIKVEITKKNIINSNSYTVDSIIHNENCRYRKEDKEGSLNSFSQFCR